MVASAYAAHVARRGAEYGFVVQGDVRVDIKRVKACKDEVSGGGRKVADAASELLQGVFGKDKNPCRSVYGVASLPLGTAVEVEVIFEVAG